MTKFWQSNLFAKVTFFAAAFMAVIVVGCTDTDDTTGNSSFIPGGDAPQVYIDEISGGFNTETVMCDSIVSDNLAATYLGSQVTVKEGQINYSFVNQVWHYGVKYPDDNEHPFGTEPKVDSAYISLAVNDYVGEEGRDYQVYVHELKKNLPYSFDSTYYSNFRIDEYIDAEPTFTIDCELGKHILLKVPNEYAEKFLSLKASEYKSYDEFRSKFHGFYFKTSESSAGNMVNKINLAESGVIIYYHNKNAAPDTTTFVLDLTKIYTDEYWGTSYYVNESFNLINRDYSFRDSNFGVDLDSETITYASGMAGLLTRLEIPQATIEYLRELVKLKGGSKIVVANATMYIPMGDVDDNSLNVSLQQIGIYPNYQSFVSIYNRNDTFEDYRISSSPEYNTVGIFGGVLNRSTDVWKINVSSLIQGLVNGNTTKNSIDIAPGYQSGEMLPDDVGIVGVASFENSPERPIKLKLTYSVL